MQSVLIFFSLLGCFMVVLAAPAKRGVTPEKVIGEIKLKDSTIHNQRSKSIGIHRNMVYFLIICFLTFSFVLQWSLKKIAQKSAGRDFEPLASIQFVQMPRNAGLKFSATCRCREVAGLSSCDA